MARKRDIVVAVIIAFTSLVALVFFGIMLVAIMSPDGGVGFAGLGNSVGVVEMYGIMNEESGRPVIRQLEKWKDNGSIKAVVVHVNSPGGGVSISQEIYDAILRTREEKPVVVAMAAVAASGGYYIACGADRVIANPGTLTGSIGARFAFHTFGNLMDKIGIGTESVKSGELKDVGSYSRPMTEKEELMLRSVVMDTYEQFVEVVAEGRDLDIEKVYPLADGSIFTGLQAYNLGLVDTIGGLYEAVGLAGELAGLIDYPNMVRPYKRKPFSVFDVLRGLLGQVGGVIDAGVTGPQLMYLYE